MQTNKQLVGSVTAKIKSFKKLNRISKGIKEQIIEKGKKNNKIKY